MRFVDAMVGMALFGLWAFCLIDVIFTPRGTSRGLPKLAWIVVVLLLSWVGATLWLLVGRPRRAKWTAPVPDSAVQPGFAGAVNGEFEYERIGAADSVDCGSRDDYLRQFRARVEQQRERYRQSLREDQG